MKTADSTMLYNTHPVVSELNQVKGFDPLRFLKDTPEGPKLELKYKKIWFRLKYPQGRFRYAALKITDQLAIIEARVYFDKNDTEPKAAFTARSDKASAPGGMYIEAAQYAAIDQALTDAGFGIQFTQDKSNADTASKGQAAVPAKAAEAAEVPVEAKREVPDAVEKPATSSAAAEEPIPNLTVVTTSVEMPAEQISEESADAVQLGGYTNEMSVEEICARMTLEEAENYIVPLGTCNGQTMGQVADRRPASLRYYISGYSGDNNILRAAATLVSQSRCQKAS